MTARDLLPSERILVSSCRHWVVLLRPIATTILAALVLLVILTLLPLAGELRLFLMLGVALAGVLIINLYYWGWRSHEYVLTDQRVILNQGGHLAVRIPEQNHLRTSQADRGDASY